MKISRHILTFNTTGGVVSYLVFAVLALSDDLRSLEEELDMSMNHDVFAACDISMNRRRHEDKYVLWFALKKEEEATATAATYTRAALIAGRYAKENGGIYLTAQEISRRYPGLLCNIVDVFPEFEEELNKEDA